MNPAIEIRALTKTFGPVRALDGLDVSVPRGAVVGFLGPNGAGKTTAMSILAGLSHATAGEASVCGYDVRTQSLDVRRHIGFLRQDPRFYPWMTGREALEFAASLFEIPKDEAKRSTSRLLDLVELAGAADRKVQTYSGGMRQRLGIAQALVADPEVLLLDEPAASLDPAGRLEVIRIMEQLRSSVTVFYSTHILQDVERVADQVVIVSRGRRVVQSTISELIRTATAGARALTIEVEGSAQALEETLRAIPMVTDVEAETGADPSVLRRRVFVDNLAEARRSIPRAISASDELLLVSCRPTSADLESVFLELTGGKSGDTA
jgi:ABC-2 type transport system ATP-binding protein